MEQKRKAIIFLMIERTKKMNFARFILEYLVLLDLPLRLLDNVMNKGKISCILLELFKITIPQYLRMLNGKLRGLLLNVIIRNVCFTETL